MADRRGNREQRRGVRGAGRAAAAGVVALLALAWFAAAAFGARPVDISGAWGVYSGPYTQTDKIVMNKQTGTFTGPGVATNGTGYTWTNHGTVTGTSVHWVFGPYNQLTSYTATCNGKLLAGATKIVGQCSDTFHHPVVKGSWVMTRKAAATKRCRVPSLTGKTLTAAKHALADAHCGLGSVARHRSATVRKGRVIASTPVSGSKHKAGTRVKLVVSRGRH